MTPPWDCFHCIHPCIKLHRARERRACQHQLWVNLITHLPLTCLPHAETETGSLIRATRGGLARFWLKPIEPPCRCASFSWRGGGKSADQTFKARWSSRRSSIFLLLGCKKNSRIIQSLIDAHRIFFLIMWLSNNANVCLHQFDSSPSILSRSSLCSFWLSNTRTSDLISAFISLVVTQFNAATFDSFHPVHLTS